MVWVDLQQVIVVFPDHIHLLFLYLSIILIKTQQKGGIGVIRGGEGRGAINLFQEHRI